MAKQGKPLPVRRQRERSREEDSILLRSAESVGRMIGTLQRELDGTHERLSEAAKSAIGIEPHGNNGSRNDRPRGANGNHRESQKQKKVKVKTGTVRSRKLR